MIEITAILSVIDRRWADFHLLVVLLMVNAGIGFYGEYQADNTISQEAVWTKNIESRVSGDVNIRLVPDQDAGNNLAKDVEDLAHATLAGNVLGSKVPIILPSRSALPTHGSYRLPWLN